MWTLSDPGFTLTYTPCNGSEPVPISAAKAAAKLQKDTGTLWLHMHARSKEESFKYLVEELGLPVFAVKDALGIEQRAALHEFSDLIFLAVPLIEVGETTDQYSEISIFLRNGHFISVTIQESVIFSRIHPAFDSLSSLKLPPTFTLLYALLDLAVDDYFPACDRVEDSVDALEESVFKNESAGLERILGVKRRLLEMRRHAATIRDVLNSILRLGPDRLPLDARPFIQDVFDHVLRLTEKIDLNRDILSTLLDAHLTVISNNLNVVMRWMTAVSTMIMTAGLIAGIYGMNFASMPEIHWKLGYPVALLLMCAACAGWYVFFRKRRWI